MRFFKITFITTVALFAIFSIIYSARISVIKTLAEEQLNLYQIKISCLDVSLASNMTIIVDKICLQSAKTYIEIVDMRLQWQYLPRFKITNVDVKRVNVKATEHLFSNIKPIIKENEHGYDNQNIRQLLSNTLQPYIKKIKQFQMPININIAEIYYLPFPVKNQPKLLSTIPLSQQEIGYMASLSAVDGKLSFSLQDADKVAFIKAELNSIKNKVTTGFLITLSSELTLLKTFVHAHQLPISTELQNTLKANKISGHIDTAITYQADILSMHNQITDLVIASDNGIGSSGAFKLMATLNFDSQLPLIPNTRAKKAKTANKTKGKKSNKNNQNIALTFSGKNAVSLKYSQPNFIAMLERNRLPPKIISLLKDNPLAQLTIEPKDKTTLTLINQQLNLSGLEMSAGGDKRVHHIKLDNIMMDFANSPKGSESSAIQAFNALTIESYIIDSELNLAEIATFTTQPVVLHLEGSLDKTKKQTKLTLSKDSLITVKNMSLTKQQSRSAAVPVTAQSNVLLILKTLTAQLAGNLQLMADNTLSVNLKAHSQALQISIPKVLHIDSFDIFSEIKGSFDDIHIKATTNADGVDLGSITVVGSVLSPKVKIAANKLLLTDLLSLNIQLPIKVELIDGIVDYRLSGQLTDLNKFEKNLFSVSVALTSVSGEVDDIWFQELNWQQNFTLLAGKITTLPKGTENLTVALIETPTPISQLSVNTNWTFDKSFIFSAKKLKVDVLGGSLYIPEIKWPFEAKHSVNVQLNSIDLEQLLALDKKQGIVVTGNISGQIPVKFDGEKYRIEKGQLYNISNGRIQVMDNPAVVELKANNTQLQLAFEALQNLHYHQLSSAVSMADDGYMLLETVIKGRNPDINNDVNLNLNLNYDLLGLLESMSITQRFEKSIIKDLQK